MFVPSGVSSCLYNGIMDQIKFTKSQIEWNQNHNESLRTSDDWIRHYYKEITEAIDFYNEHCVVSGKYLNEALDELTPIYKSYMERD